MFDTFLPPLICNMTDDHPKADLDNDNLSFHDIQDKCDTPLLEQQNYSSTTQVFTEDECINETETT